MSTAMTVAAPPPPTSTALVVSSGEDGGHTQTQAQQGEEDVDVELPVDLSQLPRIPMPKTLLLINNFVANTTRFLNHFAHECEERIARVSSNLTRVEIMLAILETKLDSIPDLTVTESDIDAVDTEAASPATATPGITIDRSELPSTDPEPGAAPPPPPPPPLSGMDGDEGAPPPPPPPMPGIEDGASSAMVVAPANELDVGEVQEVGPPILKLKDDPVYATYFTMRRLQMPEGVIEHKMKMDGVDPSILAMDPEGPSPSGGPPPPVAPPGLPPLPIENGGNDAALQHNLPIPGPFPLAMPFSPTSSTSSRGGGADSLFGDGPPPPPPPPPSMNPPLPADDEYSSSDEESVAAGGFLKLKDDPEFAKYFAMKKMGLPEGAIRQKLMIDGVTTDILSMDPEGPSPNNGGVHLPEPSSEARGPPPPPALPPLPPNGLPPPPVPRYDDDSDDDSDF